ncbi:MAG: CHAD domain-containing protein, partial [Nocardioidaceae bacterium]
RDGGRIELAAAYYDTPSLRLMAARATLRRREGGHDPGWHLKLPIATDTRRELRWPLDRGRTARTPVAVSRTVTAVTLGEPLGQIAEVRTTRRLQHLLSADGTVLAEVSDDSVSATVLLPTDGASGGDAVQVWREIEVELVRGDEETLAAVEARLKAAGARPAATSSKLRRALGDRVTAEPARPGLDERSAGATLVAYLSQHVRALRAADLAVRLGEEEGVHDLRVAARRLRTAVTAHRPLLEEQTARHLQGELRWLGAELGAARDLEVTEELLLDALTAEPAGASRRLRTGVRRQIDPVRRTAAASMREAMLSTRYTALLGDLDALLADPPLTPVAAKKAHRVLPKRLAKAWHRLEQRIVEADRTAVGETGIGGRSGGDGGAGGDQDHAAALHEVRKAAKQLRYAAEVTELAVGTRAQRLRTLAHELQKALGHHHDTVATREWIRRVADADARPADAFTLGRLDARQEVLATEAEQHYLQTLSKIRRPKSLSWLTRPDG